MTAQSTGKQPHHHGHEFVLDGMFSGWPEVSRGKMFGYPAYYVGRKLFACVFGEGVGVKVPEETAAGLLRKKHIVPFQPLGKAKMKGWVQVNRKRSSDYRKDTDIFRASFDFVGSESRGLASRESKKPKSTPDRGRRAHG